MPHRTPIIDPRRPHDRPQVREPGSKRLAAHEDKQQQDSFLLGHAQQEPQRDLGFHARPPRTSGSTLLAYDGDAPIVIAAPTGAGKGVSLLIPNLLHWGGPAIIFDPKGENYQVTAGRRRAMGQQVIVLDPFHLVTESSDRLNPFDVFDLPHAILECEAEMIAAHLATGHRFASDPFWNDMGNALLAAIIAHIAAVAPLKDRILRRVLGFINDEDLDMRLAVLLDSQDQIQSDFVRQEFGSYLSIPSDKTRPSVKATAASYLKALGTEAVLETLGPSSFSLNDVVEGQPLSIYIVIPPTKLESHQNLTRLWIGTLLTAITSRRRMPVQRTLFCVDEAASLGEFPLLRTATTLLRGYGLLLVSCYQDLSQLQSLYEKDWPTMLNNCGALAVFGARNHQMVQQWSDVLGVPARQLMDLGRDDAAMQIDGQVRFVRRLNYLRDRRFRGLYEPNPRFELLNDPPARSQIGK